MKKFYNLALLLFVCNYAISQLTALKTNFGNPQGGGLGNRVVFVNTSSGVLGSTDGNTVIDIPPAIVVFAGANASSINGKVIFIGNNASTGSEPWVSDGTIAGTMLLKDIYVGTNSSDVQGGTDWFTSINNIMYFTANDGTTRKLWKTDGTPAGTVMVKDVASSITFPFILNPVGNRLYFINGKQLWTSDGTNAGTVMVKDFSPGGVSTTFSSTFIGNGTYTFFLANDGTNGLELWRTDGTAANTIRLTDANAGVSDGFNLYNGGIPDWNVYSFNNNILFQPSTSGLKLYKSDGTIPGTVLITDINPSNSSNISLTEAVVVGNDLVFPANGELYKTNGTAAGTVLVKDINPGPGFSNPKIFYPRDNFGNGYTPGLFGGGRFFFAANNGTNGIELWISDGTTAGTTMVKDINTGAGNSLIGNGSGGNGDRYFYSKYKFFIAASDGTNGIEAWQSDGTSAGTTMISDIYPGATSSNPDFFGVAETSNKLILKGSDAVGANIYSLDATVTPFPVSLTDFTAQLKGAEVAVNWATQNEVTVANYNVQRSITGKDFLTIGKVNAIGSTGQQGYSFTDREPGKASVLYYRLEVVDKDGKISYSKIQTVKVKQSFDFSLVPTRSEAVISLDDINGLVSVKLSDANGRMILQQKQKITSGELIKISTANLSTGMYFVTIEYEGNILTKRLIK